MAAKRDAKPAPASATAGETPAKPAAAPRRRSAAKKVAEAPPAPAETPVSTPVPTPVQQEADAATAKLQGRLDELERALVESDALRAGLAAAANREAAAAELLGRAGERIAELQRGLDDATNAAEVLRQLIEASEQRRGDRERACGMLENDLEEANARIAALEEDATGLHAAKARIALFEEAAEEAGAELGSLDARIEELEQVQAEHAVALETAKHAMEAKEAELADLRKTSDRPRSRLAQFFKLGG